MRIAVSSFLAVVVCIGIFFGMELMTSSNSLKNAEKKEIPHLVYLRDSKDSKINEKKRVQPKKPEIEKPKKVELEKPKMDMKIQKDIKIQPMISKNIDLSSIKGLNGSQINVSVGLIDANTLMTLSRVYPKYPRRAKLQRKQGFVQLQFQIDVNGYTHNAVVIKSDPAGIFEESALRAIKKWRFKPISGAEPNSFIDATITFNYRLSQ